MKKLLLSLFALCCSLAYAQEKVEINIWYNDYRLGLQDNSLHLMTFPFFTEGEYRLDFDMDNPRIKGETEITITPVEPSPTFVPLKKSIDFGKLDEPYWDFRIQEEGIYRISFFIPDTRNTYFPKVHLINNKGSIYYPKEGRAEPLYLHYQTSEASASPYEWLYSELFIPEEYNVPMTNFVALAIDSAELCIGNYADNNEFLINRYGFTDGRIVSFRIGDPQWESSMKVECLDKGNQVKHVNSSPSHQLAFINYSWTNGSKLRFLINRKPAGNFMLYSAWFADEKDNAWTYLASFKVADKEKPSNAFYSRMGGHQITGFAERSMIVSNIWAKPAAGEWLNLHEAKLGHGDNPVGRTDYFAAPADDASQGFLLLSGGYGKMPPSAGVITAGAMTKAPDIDFDRLTKDIDELLAASDRNTWSYSPDRKIKVVRGEASAAQMREGIERSYDGSFSTLYHSPWRGTKFPITLTYHFAGKDTIDYVIYYPRTDGSANGNFEEIELWVKEIGGSFKKVGDYNLEGNARPAVIRLPTPLAKAGAVRFVVKSGAGDDNGFAAASEMEFYKAAGANDVPSLFTDATCSALKPGATPEEIEAIADLDYKRLARALYNKEYPVQERVRDYAPYPNPMKLAKTNKTVSYSLMDNPMGICVRQGDELVLFVGDTGGESIGLRSLNLDDGFSATDYALKEGINKINMKDKGLLYLMYHTEKPSAKPIRIHVATGEVNSLFDIKKNRNSDWRPMLNNTACDYIDVLGEYAHLTFLVSDFKRYTPDIERLMAVYDSIVLMESEFIGLNKYNRQNKNRMYFHVDPSTRYGGYAINTRTGYSKGFMRGICNPDRLRSVDIWGPAHEVGHMNQTRPGFKWVGMTEVSNNVYSMYIQQQFGNPSRLAEEKLHPEHDGAWNNRYEKGFTELLARRMSHVEHGDVFCKLIPFWQLQLYLSDVKGQTDFYADVHEQIRLNPDPATHGDAQMQFMKICCDIAKTDLTDFFEKWGMLRAANGRVPDLSSIRGEVYGRADFVITPQQIDNLKQHASQYPKPDMNLHYIHDLCVDTFKANQAVKQGTTHINGKQVEMTGWENVAVYEVYDQDKLLFITPFSNFELPEGLTNPTIKAVGALRS